MIISKIQSHVNFQIDYEVAQQVSHRFTKRSVLELWRQINDVEPPVIDPVYDQLRSDVMEQL